MCPTFVAPPEVSCPAVESGAAASGQKRQDVPLPLKVKPCQIACALSVRLVPEPALRISDERVFQAEDIARLAEHFKVDVQSKLARTTHDAS
jgi:hypothetical protein